MLTTKIYSKMFKDYPDAVSIKQLQKMLGIGRNLAYELINNNSIPHVRIGKKIVIAKVNVIDYLAKRTL
jgi:excisionase family DNA binding protein